MPFTQEKILFNVVLTLLGQHCTGKNLAQCCLTGSRQHCTEKNPVQCCLNTFGTLSKSLQKTLPRNKSCSMLS